MKKHLAWILAALMVVVTGLPALAKAGPPAGAGGSSRPAAGSTGTSGDTQTPPASGDTQTAPTGGDTTAVSSACPSAEAPPADNATTGTTTNTATTTGTNTNTDTTAGTNTNSGTATNTGTTTGTTTSADTSSTSNTSAGGTATDTSTAGGGRARGAANHRAAVAKVMAKLCTKLEWMNPKAAANVAEVLNRLEASLQAEGSAATAEEARAAVKEALKARKAAGQAGAEELDVLAEAEAQSGETDAAAKTLEERIKKEPRTRKAYERLGALYQQLGAEPLATFVDGKKPAFDVKPFVRNGRTLVPLRAIAEALGAQVGWDAQAQAVTITRGGVTISLKIGSTAVKVNGEERSIDVAAAIEQGRTVVPVRFISELLGLHVQWLPTGNLIVISSTPLADQ